MDYAGLEVSVRDGPVGWYMQLGGNVTHEQLQLTPPPDIRALKIGQLREELDRRGLSGQAQLGRREDVHGRRRLPRARAALRPVLPLVQRVGVAGPRAQALAPEVRVRRRAGV